MHSELQNVKKIHLGIVPISMIMAITANIYLVFTMYQALLSTLNLKLRQYRWRN